MALMENDSGTQFLLLKLPTETRLLIYEAHLASLRSNEPTQLIHETKGILSSCPLILEEYHGILTEKIRARQHELENKIREYKNIPGIAGPRVIPMFGERWQLYIQMLFWRREQWDLVVVAKWSEKLFAVVNSEELALL